MQTDPANSRAIEPILHPLDATVMVPGSKSLTNRAMLVAALADGPTQLTNALFSDDPKHFAESLRRLGFQVTADEADSRVTIIGLGGLIPSRRADLYVGNAGTAARFLTAFLTLGKGNYRLDGDARMRERPIGDMITALSALGAEIFCETGSLPLQVHANGLRGGQASISGNVSSQFLSGLLMSAPYARSTVNLEIENGLNSKPYVDMTLRVMSDFGVEVQRESYDRFIISSGRYQTKERYAIEPDASAASYFFAAAAVLGGSVCVRNMSLDSCQGDIHFLDILQRMGCSVSQTPDGIRVAGPANLAGVEVDMRDISDTAQTLAAIAPFAKSPTTLSGIGFIRGKETDRVRAVCTELARLGVDVQEEADGLSIQPCKAIRPALVQTYDDHRMAMAFALIGLRIPGIHIENPGCVSKTFPGYFDELEKLR